MSFKIGIVESMALLLCAAVPAMAQTNGAPGLFSGSGLSLMPDTYVAPKAQLRLDVSRLQYLRSEARGSNNFVLSAGMSSNLEVYLRLIGEQTGSISSDVSTAYGGKLLLPIRFPVLREAALWFEAASSQPVDRRAMLSVQVNRAAFVAGTGPNGAHAVILAGAAYNEDAATVMAGAGWVQPLSHDAVVSPEAIYGYFGRDSYAFMLNGAIRVLSYANVQISPGYCRSNGTTSATITVGFSLSTAPFDFNSRTAETKMRQNVLLPTIEEMERETPNQDQKKEEPGAPGGAPGENLEQPADGSKGEGR